MNTQVLDNVDTGADLTPPAADAGSAAAVGGGTEAGSEVLQPAVSRTDGAGAEPAAADPNAGRTRQETVPHAALHEAREQVKALRAQIAALEAQPKLTADDADLLKHLRQQRTQQSEPADPDFLQDPKGYVDSKLARALKKLETTEAATNETRQQVEQQTQLQQVMSTVATHERTFVTATPDYPQALAHVRAVRTEQLKLLYPQATDSQIAQQINREEIAGSVQTLQAGLNPAETIYKYAKTLGYKPPEPTTTTTQTTTQPPPDRSAARTLGSGGGGNAVADASETEDPLPEFTAALKERFGIARRR